MDLMALTKDEISSLSKSLGQPSFRAEQLWIWIKRGTSIDEMTNLPQKFRQELKDNGYFVYLPQIKKKLVSEVDGTVKYLFALKDGQLIESVVMKYEHGNTICVSSQAGCRMGCKFCASTLMGLSRNLTSSEIIGQIIAAQNDFGEKISNIVMMGIGEPLDNYDNVIEFLKTVNSKDSLNIGYRHISLSTCGVVDGIKKLQHENLPITLSISLHSVDNDKRKELMPITNKWSVDELLNACSEYFKVTGRRISFEYTLISGENDSLDQAKHLASELKRYLKNMPIHVNLIPLNPVNERTFSKSSREAVEKFKNKLTSLGINATVRRKLGPDINASCGQLRLNNSTD